MRVVTGREMREIDREAIEGLGIPGPVLMENAGSAVAREIERILLEHPGSEPIGLGFRRTLSGTKVAIFCGKGNNGGDGFVVARHLLDRGADVSVFLVWPKDEITGDARLNLEILERMDGNIAYLGEGASAAEAATLAASQADVIVDAILGTGIRGPVTGPAAAVIEALMRAPRRLVVSVDVPSGVQADTGAVVGPAVKADVTVTFALPKVGLVVYPGAEYCGRLVVADIGIPRRILEAPGRGFTLIDREFAAGLLPPRRPDSHKGSYGRVLVVAGSEGLAGAAVLSSVAVLRSGAGLVTLAGPESLVDAMASRLPPEVMTLALPETRARSIARASAGVVIDRAGSFDALAIGPGLSRNPETQEAVREIVSESPIPVVVDADGLNALAADLEFLVGLAERARAPLVFTPHPGEMARLTGLSPAEVQADRIRIAQECAEAWGAAIVLKGARTVVAGPGGDVYINTSGNPGMATAGAGDVLTGVVAGLIAQGLDGVKAAALGVYVHGLAGDLARDEVGSSGLVASDILDRLPRALDACRAR